MSYSVSTAVQQRHSVDKPSDSELRNIAAVNCRTAVSSPCCVGIDYRVFHLFQVVEVVWRVTSETVYMYQKHWLVEIDEQRGTQRAGKNPTAFMQKRLGRSVAALRCSIRSSLHLSPK